MTPIKTETYFPRIKGFCTDCERYSNLADSQSDELYGYCHHWKQLVKAQDYCAHMEPAAEALIAPARRS